MSFLHEEGERHNGAVTRIGNLGGKKREEVGKYWRERLAKSLGKSRTEKVPEEAIESLGIDSDTDYGGKLGEISKVESESES